ncbi:MAG: erythromycin biosynthesis sensory transduction protein eryC1 [Azospira oryzae]|nr:MAG: erythromycin biosynthesis sensory transduction protein eryC1 [Azospira oryzae]PZP79687.1 MAG: erythromycin biosynthesis sensory transduction protein eryC1 [Azospira oryzae]
MNIPMVDLKAEYRELGMEIEKAVREVLASSHFILGPHVKALEQEVAAYLGVKHAVAVASGTDALHLALRAAGVQGGDEVITTAFTFIATAEAIAYIGARPVFVDIDPATFNLDPGALEAAITDRTRAILPVHLYGQAADMDPIMEIARRRGLRVIEDCAQSFGADYRGRRTGTLGDVGCFSFYPSKNLGAYGDGGMVTTNDDALADQVRVLRDHGSRVRYHHSVIGYNSRLDELQAAILRVKLKRIEAYNARRREAAARYTAQLAGSPIVPPKEAGYGRHVYHQYTVRSGRRDAIQKALAEAGIASAIYYPIPLHRQEVYQAAYRGLTLPETEAAAREVLSLPMHPYLTSQQIDRVCEVALAAVR